MNDEVLRRELRRIAIENQHRCFGCGFEHNCGIHGCAIIREALEWMEPKKAAVYELTEALGNEPLDPEQLREMEEEPVYLSGEGLDRWDIFCGVSTDGLACFLRGALPMAGCGKTWAPYRRKPEKTGHDG